MATQTKTMVVKSDTALAETKTTIRDTVTFDTSKLPNGITYKGLKAVLSFADPIQWNRASTYDALTVVWDDGSHGSYASKRPVPANIELTNEFYWLRTADLDAQVEMYRQEVREMGGRVTANAQAIAAETARAETAEQTLQANIDSIVSNSPFTTPEAFGAKGDGISDDSTALTEMFNSNYNVFVFSAKTYSVNKTVLMPVKDIVIYGNGATISNSNIDSNNFTDTNSYLLSNRHKTFDGSTTVYIDGLTLNGNYGEIKNVNGRKAEDFPFEYGTLLKLNGCGYVRIENCSFDNSLQDGISLCGCVNAIVKNCRFANIGNNISSYNYGGTNNAVTFYSYALTDSQSFVNCKYLSIYGNTIENVRDECFRIDQCSYASVKNNYVKICQQHFIESFQYTNIDCSLTVDGNKVDYITGAFITFNTDIKCNTTCNVINNVINNMLNDTYNSLKQDRGGGALCTINNPASIKADFYVANNYYSATGNTEAELLVYFPNANLTMENNTIIGAFKNTPVRIYDGVIINNRFNLRTISNAVNIRGINKSIISYNTFESTNGDIINVENHPKILYVMNNTADSGKFFINTKKSNENAISFVENNITQTSKLCYYETQFKAAILINNICSGTLGTFNNGAIGEHAVNSGNIIG